MRRSGYLYFWSCLLGSLFLLKNIGWTVPTTSVYDVLETKPIAHQLLLTNVRLVQNKTDFLVVTLSMLNMHKDVIIFGQADLQADYLTVKFEESFKRNPLIAYKEDIVEALLLKDVIVERGKMQRNIRLVLEKTKDLAKIDIPQQRYNQGNRRSRRRKEVTKDELLVTISEEQWAESASILKERVADEPVQYIYAEKESTTNEQLVESNTSVDSNTALDLQEETNIEEIAFDSLGTLKRAAPQVMDSGNGIVTNENGERLCPDIIIDSLKIVKAPSKKWVTIEYTITNKGNIPADLYGDSKTSEDNLALRAFLTRSERLTKGAIPIGGIFIKKDLEDGILLPNQSYTNKVKLNIRKMTRFTPYIVINLDPFSVLSECDKTNNRQHILIKEPQ